MRVLFTTKVFIITFIFTTYFISTTQAQCTDNIHITNQRPVLLCNPGGSVQLNSVPPPGYSCLQWTPSTGLNNDTLRNPTATLTDATGLGTSILYTVETSAPNFSNVVFTEDFNNGTAGWSAGAYVYVPTINPPTTLLEEGTFTLKSDSHGRTEWNSCPGHTPGVPNDLLYLCNAYNNPLTTLYWRFVPVQPNTDYIIGLYTLNAYAVNPPILQFGTGPTEFIGPSFQAPPGNPCTWYNYQICWRSGPNTNMVPIYILNTNPNSGNGVDFALDDIYMYEACKYTDTITVTVLPEFRGEYHAKICKGGSISFGGKTYTQPVSNQKVTIKNVALNNCDSIYDFSLEVVEITPQILKNPDAINCYNPAIDLDAGSSTVSGGSANDLSYHWGTTNGHIVSDVNQPVVTVDGQGTYVVTVTFDDGNIICTATSSVFVNMDTTKPRIIVPDTVEIGCGQTEVFIDAEKSSSGSSFSYSWITSDGNILTGEFTLKPLVNKEGHYTLTIINNDNGCEASKEVYVYVNNGAPRIDIKTPPKLDCKNTRVEIDASGSSQGYDYKWTTGNGGHIVSGGDTPKPTVDSSGTYTLEITDPSGKCKNTATVTVVIDTIAPKADAGKPDSLDCANPSIKLNGSVISTSTKLVITWTGPGIVSGDSTLTPVIDKEGTYILTIEDTLNHCISVDSVSVYKDSNIPIASAGIDTVLSCANATIILDGSQSSSGSDLTVVWKIDTYGHIVSGDSTYSPVIDQPGVYVITIKSAANGCILTDTVTVGTNFTAPVAEAGADQLLTCVLDELTLDGSGSSSGHHSYQWHTPDGTIKGASDIQNPVASQAGTYYILVTDDLNGCTAEDSVIVNADANLPVIKIAAPDSITCTAKSVNIDASQSSTGTPYTYEWTTANGHIASGNTSLTPTVDANGNYLLTIIDTTNHCKSTASIKIEIDTATPKGSISQLVELTCAQSAKAIHFQPSGTGAVSFAWFDGNNVPVPNASGKDSIVVSASGLYYIVVTNSGNGCTSRFQTNVTENKTPPTLAASVAGKIDCNHPSVTLSSSGSSTGAKYHYTWSNAAGVKVNTGNQPDAQATAGGTYQLNITDTTNGCSSTKSIIVDTDTTKPTASAAKSGDINCKDKTITLDASASSAGVTYQWSGDNGQVITPANAVKATVTQPGSYIVTVTNPANGCTNTALITVNQSPTPSATVNTVQPACPGEKGSLTFNVTSAGTPPYQYSVNNGGSYQNGPAFADLSPGTYIAVMLDAEGCSIDTTVIIDKPIDGKISLDSVYIIFLNDVTINATTNIPAASIESIQWLPPTGLSCDDCLNPVVNIKDTIDYEVIITTKSGCTVRGHTRVYKRIIVKPEVFIPNGFTPNEDGVNDNFVIYTNDQIVKVKELHIYNRWGDQVFTGEDFPPNDDKYGWDGYFRSKLVNSGVYVYWAKVITKDGKELLYKGEVTIVN